MYQCFIVCRAHEFDPETGDPTVIEIIGIEDNRQDAVSNCEVPHSDFILEFHIGMKGSDFIEVEFPLMEDE